jgi:hypothetical protein
MGTYDEMMGKWWAKNAMRKVSWSGGFLMGF